MKKFNLKSDLILNKKFDTELSGYSAEQVDKYLDLILADYREYEDLAKVQIETINEKDQIISDKDDEVKRLELEILSLKDQLTKTASITNASLHEELLQIKKEMNKRK